MIQIKMERIALVGILVLLICWTDVNAYPIDGYKTTGIRRLLRLELIMKGEIDDRKGILYGARKKLADLDLTLCGRPVLEELQTLPKKDSILQEDLDGLFPYLNSNYSVAVLDITAGVPPVYAARKETKGYQPGSVGKLAVITGLFTELANLYPHSWQKRTEILKKKYVKAGKFALYDHHTVPFFDTMTYKFFKRTVQAEDVFSLYEWADHTVSVSNNGAASVVWREAMLIRAFGERYLNLTQEEADQFFKETPRDSLARMANRIVNNPLRALDIGPDEWRLGSMFTDGATSIVPPMGGSIGTPQGLIKWMLALERGDIIDYESSLEIKRLIYMTDRRIRYARASVLDSAAVYFKSGSLYSFLEGTPRVKYAGTRYNYMNSVCIVEHRDGTSYLVALESNVLGKNSNYDHYALATRIDGIIRKRRQIQTKFKE